MLKVWRWLDVTGFMTKWHSRRAHILDIDPPQRVAWVMVTEYERKLLHQLLLILKVVRICQEFCTPYIGL